MTAESKLYLEKFLSTPSARRATSLHPHYTWGERFLSTPSARRATGKGAPAQHDIPNFYPRPPRGGRRMNTSNVIIGLKISIHALREEGDA